MKTPVRRSLLLALVIGLLSSPLADGGSIKTFHRSWTHGSGTSASTHETYTVAENPPCIRAVEQAGTPTEVARAPVKSKTQIAKEKDQTAEKTATRTTSSSRR